MSRRPETLMKLSQGYADGRVDPLVQTVRDHAPVNRPTRQTDPRDGCTPCRLLVRTGRTRGACLVLLPASPGSTWAVFASAPSPDPVRQLGVDRALAAADDRIEAAYAYRTGAAETCTTRQDARPQLELHGRGEVA